MAGILAGRQKTEQPNKRERGLTIKQRLFVSAYLANGYNATQAAREAGYRGDENTLHSIGSENLQKPAIMACVRARVAELDKEFENRIMGRYETLARLTMIARGDLGDIDVSSPEALRKAKADGKSHLIKKIRERTIISAKDDTETHEFEIEMYSAHDALRDLGKHHALFTDRVEVADWRAEAEALGIPADSLLGNAIGVVERAAKDKGKA